jgi:putative tryptophan/tyrosine transport system substrate-binding protein
MTRVLSKVALLTLALLAAPRVAEAQPVGNVYRIGIAFVTDSNEWRSDPTVRALLDGLRDLGYIEGRNLALEVRVADWHRERLPALLAELLDAKVDVLYAFVCEAGFRAMRHATTTIPIVVGACNDDLVGQGIVSSLARPGGNITGQSKLTPELAAKRLSLLKEVVPAASRLAVLWNPNYSDFAADWRELRAAATPLGVTIHSAEVRTSADLEPAFTAIARARVNALITFSDVTVYAFAPQVAQLVARSRLPAIYAFREVPAVGGLMSYGPNLVDMFRRSARYVAKIFEGGRPADLPIEQPTKFEVVINLRTTKVLGLTIPPSVLARADEVIR